MQEREDTGQVTVYGKGGKARGHVILIRRGLDPKADIPASAFHPEADAPRVIVDFRL